MIKRPVPLTLTTRRTPSKLTYWRTLLIDVMVKYDIEVVNDDDYEDQLRPDGP